LLPRGPEKAGCVLGPRAAKKDFQGKGISDEPWW
jgi:hypothetical protein